MKPGGQEKLRRRASLVLMACSGFAGLGYQIVWTQQGALWLGHESAALLAVVTAFFGGLALGALTLGRRIERSAWPGRWYVVCEAAIALWSAVLLMGMSPVSAALLELTGAQPSPAWQWAVAFCGFFLVLLPATVAMGAALPAMDRVMAPWRGDGSSIAPLYASNTLGAVFGVLVTTFLLVPTVGLSRTALVCIALNVMCAVLAWVGFAKDRAAVPAQAMASADRQAVHRSVLARLAVTGLLGIGYEVLVVRVLSQVSEDTVYTFAMLLGVYLVGTALGAAAYQRLWARSADSQARGDRLFTALAAACLFGTASLWWCEEIKAALLQQAGVGMAAAVAAEAALALLAFGPPTFVMGALFSHLTDLARSCGIGCGLALGFNTLGAAAAPLLFGVLLVTGLGPKLALLSIALLYLTMASPPAWRSPIAWVPAGAIGLALAAPPLAFVDVPRGGRIVRYEEGLMAAVSVVEDAQGVARLRINNRQQEGSSATQLVDGRQGLIPVLLHPAPKRALFLGLGTGVTANTAASDTSLQVDAVELLPEVVRASEHFRDSVPGASGTQRLSVIAADARRYVRTTPKIYDVIVSDNFHPARSGSGSLYTVEHFQAVRGRLAADGVFCQWLPLHQMDLETLRSIVRSFITVYPAATAVLASNSLTTPVLGLVAHRGDRPFDLDRWRQRSPIPSADAPAPAQPAKFGLEDEWALLGGFIAGPGALARFAADAPANTDDRPIVPYRAPRATYAPEAQPHERLAALLRWVSIEPSDVLGPSADASAQRRLAAYWAARDRYLDAGQGVRPSADVREMLAQVREPLLAVLNISPDFRPAYDPLLRMALALGRTDASAARALLQDLVLRQPARPEAARALDRLSATAP